jgi:hypothetical protein
VGHQIRVTVKRREPIDLDKLTFALLQIVKQQQLATKPKRAKRGGVASTPPKESAA